MIQEKGTQEEAQGWGGGGMFYWKALEKERVSIWYGPIPFDSSLSCLGSYFVIFIWFLQFFLYQVVCVIVIIDSLILQTL